MNWIDTLAARIILTILSVACVGVFVYLWLDRIRDKGSLGRRLVATLFAFGFLAISVVPSFRSGDEIAQLMGLGYALIFAVMMIIVWVPVIAGFFGDLVGNLYTGGSDEAEPKPFYSIFRTKRGQGKYLEALAEVRRQLDKFPSDFEGTLLLAELQAENLDDLPGAEVTIGRLCAQPGLAPANVASALNHLADWHLKLTKDRQGAQKALEQIIAQLPDTEWSLKAAQRIAHLANTDDLLAPVHRQRVTIRHGEQRLGLVRDQGKLRAKEVDQGQLAADYVKHLEEHPLDTEVREKLAIIYVSHFRRLDLGLDQLEQLVQQPNRPAKQVTRWLNLMADLQVQEDAPLEMIRDTLQRIVDLYPDLPAGQNARRRIDTVRLELKAKEKAKPVQMGDYEQNIGLKRTN